MTLPEAEAFLRDKIPLARHLGMRFVEYTGDQLVVEAPLSCNHNHHGTAFGGSLNALATLAAYGILWLETKDAPKDVVIKDSSIAFLRPVAGDLRAVALRPAKEALAAFAADLAAKGKGRLVITAFMDNQAGERAVEFKGTFVVRQP